MYTAIVIAMGLALFFALMTNFTIKPSVNTRISIFLAFIAILGGFLIYGYGFTYMTFVAAKSDEPFLSKLCYAVLRAVHSTLHMFVSANEYGDIKEAPHMQEFTFMALFWLIHTFAFYCTANAFLKVISAGVIKHLRIFACRFHDLILAYGISEKSVAFLTELMQDAPETLVVVGEEGVLSPYRAGLEDLGAIVLTGEMALHPTVGFLKTIGMHGSNHTYRFFFLNESTSENLSYATQLKECLEARRVTPEQTHLTLFAGADVTSIGQMQSGQGDYGYGSVTAYTYQDMAGRLMIRHCPPYKTLTFDERGYAREDFDAVVVGFGQIGQGALRYLCMNTAFPGCHRRFTVFDPTCPQRRGSFQYLYPDLEKFANIQYVAEDARSSAFFEFLEAHRTTLRYVALCCGSTSLNAEIEQLIRSAAHRLPPQLMIVRLTQTEVNHMPLGLANRTHWPLFTKELLVNDTMDEIAKLLNHQYFQNTTLTPQKAWENCDYFSRTSCRAFADYVPAFLAMVHTTQEELVEGKGPVEKNPQLLETLAQAEHLRWNSFHLCYGYRTMPEETLSARLKLAKERREDGQDPGSPQKDTYEKQHACLVPWDDLDALSLRVGEALGKPLDYKQLDRNNIFAIPQILKKQWELNGKGRERIG